MEFFGKETQDVQVDKKASDDKLYLVMNKPCGVVCSSVSDSHTTVFELLSPDLQKLLKAKRGERLHTVGRLDCDTSGLLFITNDGTFSHELTAPEKHVSKIYVATLKKSVSENEQKEYKNQFFSGIRISAEKKASEYITLPAQIEFISMNQCKVIVSEGKFHQVRRMFAALDNEVIALKRIKIGQYELPQELEEGKYLLLKSLIV